MHNTSNKYKDVSIQYITKSEEWRDTSNSITYMNPKLILQIELPKDYHILFDEYHNAMFKDDVF